MRGVAAGMLAAALFAAPVLAQDTHDEQRAARERDARAQLAQAAREAVLLAAAEDERPVAYAEVLAAPDDVALNFRFAKTQVRQGDLKGASTTLERILLMEPELPRIRLFYAVVLYRLGNLHEAEREFHAVAALPLADPLRREVEGYLSRIAREQRLHRYTGSLSVGAQHDTNRNASPSSRAVLFQDQLIALSDDSLREHDLAFVSVFQSGVERDLATQEGDKLHASFSYYDSAQHDLEEFELQALTLDTGARLVTDWGTFSPQVSGNTVLLAHEKYIESAGLGLRVDRQVGEQVALFANARLEYQDFKSVDSSPTAGDRSGGVAQLDLGAEWPLGPTQRLGGQLGATHKQAREDYHAYTGGAALLSHTWLLGGGQFLLSTAVAQYDTYREAQEFVSHRRRRDAKLRGQLLYGVPLERLVGGWLELRALRGTVVTLRVEHIDNASTLRNYEYTNTAYALSFSSSFEY
jgi:hypothetical protein